MSDEIEALRVRVRLLETEMAGISGMLLALAEHFELEGNAELAATFHERAAQCRKWSGVQPSGGVQ